MKKFLFILCAALFTVAVSCEKAPTEPSRVPVTSVSLDQNEMTMGIGEYRRLTSTVSPSDATDKSVSWSSSNEAVATVAGGTVTAVAAGSTTITVTTADQGKTATCTVEVTEGLVDLGLSVKWKSCNLGASKPEEYGKYFAWGDVKGQTRNGSSWSGGGFSTYPAYELDANNNLKPEYDAAHVILGGTWRMPTKTECQELIDNCTSTWTSDYNGTGVAGRIFTSKKTGYTDKSIFLPAAGCGCEGGFLYDASSYGGYWSSTFGNDYNSWDIYFYSVYVFTYYGCRILGLSVRPVSE